MIPNCPSKFLLLLILFILLHTQPCTGFSCSETLTLRKLVPKTVITKYNYFKSKAQTLKRGWQEAKTSTVVHATTSSKCDLLILYHLQQLLCHWICKQWMIWSVPVAGWSYKQKGSHFNIYTHLLLKHLKPTIHSNNKTEHREVSANYSLTCLNKNLMENCNSLSHWQ